ncbi:MAG: AI-2E family transporter, partial [Candidatus Dormibacteraceae bacterium]
MDENHTESRVERSLAHSSLLLTLIFITLLFAFFFVASEFCIIIVASAFFAILVDPLVVQMERLRIGRVLASGLVMLCAIILAGYLCYAVGQKANSFSHQLPAYSGRIHRALLPITSKIEEFQKNAESLVPRNYSQEIPEVRVQETPDWASFLARGAGSISGVLIILGVVPFLAFFMLIRKRHMDSRFSSIFEKRLDVPKFIHDVNQMVRGFVVGNLIVGLVLAIVTSVVFLLIGMQNAVALGIIIAILNLIPFIGLILALAVATLAALAQFNTLGVFVVIFLTILILHITATNLLIPRIIGARVSVGPVAIVVGMLFWGWLWGAFGVLLAVPLTGFLKLVADYHPALTHLSNMLAETPCRPQRVIRVEAKKGK